jgi:photosystem II PsbU protein
MCRFIAVVSMVPRRFTILAVTSLHHLYYQEIVSHILSGCCILSCDRSSVAAFVQHSSTSRAATELAAERRAFLSAATAAFVAVTPFVANAVRDYENIAYLGGSDIVDINNANVRVYLKFPGMYPTIAGKIASNGPYSSVSDVFNIPGLTGSEKEILKKYESRFVAKKPEADYVIDKFNNGLYK